MSDLIKRLRGWPGPRGEEVSILRTMTEAADKIGDMQDEIEKLRAALQSVRREALKEAARRLEELHSQHKYNPQTGEGSEHDAGYYRAISEGAAWICALGEKE